MWGMRIFFVMSEELRVLNEVKQYRRLSSLLSAGLSKDLELEHVIVKSFGLGLLVTAAVNRALIVCFAFILSTRLEPKSDKESTEVERTNDKEVEITNIVIPVNVNEEEDEITDEVYELKRREKGKIIEESRSTPFPTLIRSPKTHTNLVSSDTEKLQELTITHTQTTSSSRSQHTNLSRAN
ncbi:hypothetical protein Tco_0386633 [Tanacetum coccineum]